MKKNKIFTLGLVITFVFVVSLTLVSGTFAKYTSTVTGNDSAIWNKRRNVIRC